MAARAPSGAVDPRLQRYRDQRDFARTAEPSGDGAVDAGGWQYLVQRHAASRLHYDLRLELDGVLLSWAVPKGPSVRAGDRRLAMRTEDHPLAYATFEGTIPAGEYGGGTVQLWDRGRWRPIGDPHAGLAEGKLTFELEGERLRGGWTLVRTQGRSGDPWLLLKRRDAHADEDGDGPIRTHTTSVATGRTLEQIAADRDAVWRSNRGEAELVEIPGAVRGAVPWPCEPQLPVLVADAPAGDGWVHEIKHDGYRALVRLVGGRAEIRTRGGQDWTARLAPLASAFEALGVPDAVFDGELVALDAEGRSQFSVLQRALAADPGSLYVYVFDLLSLGELDLRGATLLARKEQLATRIPAGTGRVRYGDHVLHDGPTAFAQACALGAEGLVSKRADAAYHHGRHASWTKAKCTQRRSFLVCGWTTRGDTLSALLLADPATSPPRYAGKVGAGLSEADRRELPARLEAREVPEPPIGDVPRPTRGTRVRWAAPELVVDVAFSGWTDEGRLRHPTFQGARPEPGPRPRVSNADRVVYPALGITKGDLAAYVARVAAWFLPGVVHRPLAVFRCPTGLAAPCFFQKHWEHLPAGVRTVRVPGDDEPRIYIDDGAGLLALFQHGVIELHPSGARVDALDRPDRLVIDLDPDPALPFSDVIAAARDVRARLERLGLRSYVRTTGGKGLHVVFPVAPEAAWEEARAFTRAIAEAMVRDAPASYVAVAAKAKRKGKIYVDYLRNGEGATAIASWSPRARPGATVAVPLSWDALRPDLDPAGFTVQTVAPPAQDPWAGVDDPAPAVTPELLAALTR